MFSSSSSVNLSDLTLLIPSSPDSVDSFDFLFPISGNDNREIISSL